MSKSWEEIAAEITIAWISTWGDTPNGNVAMILQQLTEDKVSQFYKTVHRAIVEASRTTSMK